MKTPPGWPKSACRPRVPCAKKSRVGQAHKLGGDGVLFARSLKDLMKRIALWIFYGIGVLAIGYLALYAYVTFSGHRLHPGDPICIFLRPDAPNYSAATDGALA